MRYIHNFWIILIGIGFTVQSCAIQRQFDQEDLMVSYERTACYGECPVYTLKINKKGKMLFEGEENFDLIGKFWAQLSGEELEKLHEAFDKTNFFKLEDRYYKNVSDLPTKYIYYSHEGDWKKIMDYYGAPEALEELEKYIEDLIYKTDWKKV